MRHTNICIILSILIALLLVNNVSAITAAVQPARMVVNMQVGEKVEKSIKILNKNDYSVTVNITISGELSKNIVLAENFVELNADEEKSIKFTIEPKKAGETENTINFLYKSENVQGIGFISKVIVVASGKNSADDSNSDDNADNNTNSTKGNVNVGVNNNAKTDNSGNIYTNTKLVPYIPLIITGAILLVILIILIVISGKPKQNQENKPAESNNQNNFYKENKLKSKKRLKEPRE